MPKTYHGGNKEFVLAEMIRPDLTMTPAYREKVGLPNIWAGARGAWSAAFPDQPNFDGRDSWHGTSIPMDPWETIRPGTINPVKRENPWST